MEWSNYNFIYKSKKHGYLLYNSLSNCFAELDLNTYRTINKIKKQISEKQFIYVEQDEFQRQLLEHKIIVSNQFDDLLIQKCNINSRRFDKSVLNLTIAPTANCNFNCTYCFEENRQAVYMSDKTEEKLLEFIKSFESKFKYIAIAWFGGEPLMAFKRMQSISNKLIKNNYKFHSDIITNGYLLSEKIISQLSLLKTKSIQITIDGLKDTHNSRRPHNNKKDTFNKIIGNIETLFEITNDIKVTIRVNIDHDNKHEFIDFYNFINSKFQNKNIFVYPAFVENINSCNSISNCNIINSERADFLLSLYRKHNFCKIRFYPNLYRECKATNIFGFVIGADANVYKCWNDIGKKDNILLNLNSPNTINEVLLSRYLAGISPFEDPKCQNCFQLPICNGACTYFRIQNNYEDKNNELCDFKKDGLANFLDVHYDIKKTNQ